MKIVWYDQEGHDSQIIKEHTAYEYADQMELIETKASYEFARGYINGQLAVIYQDNRVIRTRNTWYEYRGITALATKYGEKFIYSHHLQWKGFDTEIDAVSRDKSIAVELKRQTISQDDLEFLEQKTSDLGFEHTVIIAPQFRKECTPSSSTTLFRFQPSWSEIMTYYSDSFKVWPTFWKFAGQRHFRLLMSNGVWKPQRRRYTQTAKWNAEDRMIREINYYMKRKKGPIKVYYSLSRMVSPLREYEGRGRPFDLYIPVLDVDGTHDGNHIIGKEGYCQLCLNDSTKKLHQLQKNLKKEDYELKIFHSGTKGYHVHLLNDGQLKEIRQEEMEKIVTTNKELVDTFLAKSTQEFDSHRIFKVPYSVDCTTGKVVSPDGMQLNLDDQLELVT